MSDSVKVDVGADAVPTFQKALADKKKSKAADKADKFKELEKFESGVSFNSKPSTEEYRKGWDRIFGKKA